MATSRRGKSTRGVNRRNALLRTAWEIFSEQGYQSASMDMVVARAGGSKQTLYNYFKSKEELLRAVLEGRREELAQRVYSSFEIESDFVGSLWNFSVELLDVTINSDLVELYRLAIAESKTLMLGEWIFELGFAGNWRVMADYLERQLDSSRQLGDGGWTAAMHLRGLLEGDLLLRRLCGVMTQMPKEELCTVAHSGLKAFLQIYAPSELDRLHQIQEEHQHRLPPDLKIL